MPITFKHVHADSKNTMPAFRQTALPYRRRPSPTNASFGATKNTCVDHGDYAPLTARDENKPSASDPPLYHFAKRQDEPLYDSRKAVWPPLSTNKSHSPPSVRLPPPSKQRPLPLRPLQLRVESQEPDTFVFRPSAIPSLPPPPGLWNVNSHGSQPRLTNIDPRMMAPIGSERRRKSEPDISMADPGDELGLDTPILSFGATAGTISTFPPAPAKPRPLDPEQFRMLFAQHRSRYTHAPEMMSPLNPLRELAPPRFWETVPTRKTWNFKRPIQPLRWRSAPNGCDDYMLRFPKDVFVPNQHRHCRECQRDTLAKRLLAYTNALDIQERTPMPRDIIIDLTRTLAAEYEAMDSDSDDDVAIITPTSPTLALPEVDLVVDDALCSGGGDQWVPGSPRIVDLDSFDEPLC